MADNKTEQPTPKRLREARRKGQVSKSNDLTQAILFLAAGTALSVEGVRLTEDLRALLIRSFDPALIASITETSLINRTGGIFREFSFVPLPLLGALLVASIAINFLQLGGITFSSDALSPKLDKLNPVQGFQRIFLKPKTYFELAKNLVKFSAILGLVYATFRGGIRDVILASRLGLSQTAVLTAQLLFRLLLRVGGAYLAIGAADFFFQKRFYLKELKMTKQEVKREHKEDEGDPHIKYQRKHLHQQLLAQNMLTNVLNAKAVVVNPTHLAIALEYEEASMAAPQIAAKGQMILAHKIVEIAKQHCIPIVRNIPLARGLFALEIGDEIPEELYQAVAEILNWVYELAHMESL